MELVMSEKLFPLSPSSLSIFEECPRCFWLYVNKGHARPSIPVATITSGMDRVLKNYFDGFRVKGALPPEIDGKVRGRLVGDLSLMEDWRRGITIEDRDLGVRFRGKLDECLVSDDGLFIPLDFKTKGDEPKDNAHIWYQTQLESYSYLLSGTGYPTAALRYLVFVFPKKVGEAIETVQFGATVREIPLKPDRIRGLLTQAAQLLAGPCPRRHAACQFCQWVERTQQL